jgi:hypothetical protein
MQYIQSFQIIQLCSKGILKISNVLSFVNRAVYFDFHFCVCKVWCSLGMQVYESATYIYILTLVSLALPNLQIL